jgi:hypothetical protein
MLRSDYHRYFYGRFYTLMQLLVAEHRAAACSKCMKTIFEFSYDDECVRQNRRDTKQTRHLTRCLVHIVGLLFYFFITLKVCLPFKPSICTTYKPDFK